MNKQTLNTLKSALMEGVCNALEGVGATHVPCSVKLVKDHPYLRGQAIEATVDACFQGKRVWVTVALELESYGPRGSHGIVWGVRKRGTSFPSYSGTYYYEASPLVLRQALNAKSCGFFC